MLSWKKLEKLEVRKFGNFKNIDRNKRGWKSIFGTTNLRTTDISKFQNVEYLNIFNFFICSYLRTHEIYDNLPHWKFLEF